MVEEKPAEVELQQQPIYDTSQASPTSTVTEPTKPDMSELGVTGTTQYGDLKLPEYNAQLIGRSGIRIYDRMRRSDAQVRASLKLVKTPITAAQWYVEPVSEDPKDVEQAQFIEWALFDGINRAFIDFIWEALLLLDYGWYAFEKVFTYDTWTPPKTPSTRPRTRPRTRQVVKWQKFAPRHPMTLVWWLFDRYGQCTGMRHQRLGAYIGSGPQSFDFGDTQVDIPINKLLVFSLDAEGGNPSGMSVLRSAYKHWYYKENLYKIDAIQKERHGIGVPKITLPTGFTDEDKQLANEMGENLRTNEKSHVVLPPGWLLEFASPNTLLVDPLKSAEHHDLMIGRNVLGQFMNLGSQGSGASRALGASQIEIFIKTVRYIADIVKGVMNETAIPELIRYNYGPGQDEFPELRVRRIGEEADFRAWSVAIRNLVEPGVVTPTPDLEQFVRDQMDLPKGGAEVLNRTAEDRLTPPAPPVPPVDTTTLTPNGNANADGSRKGSLSGKPKE